MARHGPRPLLREWAASSVPCVRGDEPAAMRRFFACPLHDKILRMGCVCGLS